MKSLILAALAVTVLASAASVQAADRKPMFDGAAFFAENASRNGQ